MAKPSRISNGRTSVHWPRSFRKGDVIAPNGNTVLQPFDEVFAVARTSQRNELAKLLHGHRYGKHTCQTSFMSGLFGRKLATHEAAHQTISKKIGLAVFASDALSSIAYATQEF